MARISEIILLQQVEQPAVIIETQTEINGLPAAIGGSFMKIATYLQQQGVIATDIPESEQVTRIELPIKYHQ